jgi:hypothetical protein
MSRETKKYRCGELKQEAGKMMAQGIVVLNGQAEAAVEVRRGTVVISAEGREAGKLAAVVVGPDSRQAVCLILGHLPDAEGYQSLPVSWIARVEADGITLNASLEVILALPDWHPM